MGEPFVHICPANDDFCTSTHFLQCIAVGSYEPWRYPPTAAVVVASRRPRRFYPQIVRAAVVSTRYNRRGDVTETFDTHADRETRVAKLAKLLLNVYWRLIRCTDPGEIWHVTAYNRCSLACRTPPPRRWRGRGMEAPKNSKFGMCRYPSGFATARHCLRLLFARGIPKWGINGFIPQNCYASYLKGAFFLLTSKTLTG